MPAFRVAASDLAVSVMVAADCLVLEVLPHSPSSVAQNLTPRHRITALNNVPIKDRCELRHLLNGLHPSAIVEVEYTLAFEHTKRINIENSVECDGVQSTMAPQADSVPDDDEEEDVFDSAAPPQATGHLTPTPSLLQQQQQLQAQPQSILATSQLHTSPARSLRHATSDHLTAGHGTEGDFGVSLRAATGTEEGVSGFFPSDSPRLLAFDFVNMDATVRAKEKKEIREASIRQKIYRATNKVRSGCCVIMVCISVNPMAELELLAMQLNRRVISLELGVKLRLRPTPDTVTRHFQEAMRSGSWFVVKNAHKSISTMRHLEQMVEEIRARDLEGVHQDAKIVIFTEPHPHFPVGLTHGAVLTKVHTSFSQSSFMSMTAASMTSTTCCRLLQGGGKLNSQLDDGLPTAAAAAAAKQAASTGRSSSGTSSNEWSGANCGPRKVKMSAAVEIVDIEAREVFNAAAQFGAKSNRPVDVSGSVCLRHTFSGLIGDKFLCVTSGGERGRYAVGSSLGNVYFLDSDANAMLQIHTHDSCVWDLSFYSKYEFATGSEDGSAVEWSFDEASPEAIRAALEDGADGDAAHASLGQKRSAVLGSDIYCTTYLASADSTTQMPSKMHRSPLIAGGLANHLLVLPSNPSSSAITVPTPSNCQVVASFPGASQVVVGGGDGSLSIIDVNDGVSGSNIVRTLHDHTRKVPTLSVRDENSFFSGGFDSTIRGWDHRMHQSRSTHTLKLKNYVTGLSVDDVHLAACAGENLYMWDVRKLHEVLGGFPQAWKGLSRGIIVDSVSRQVVTASPDGVVRFWNFV